jgi:alpha-tubulin suppressor-like RCC1 family protein
VVMKKQQMMRVLALATMIAVLTVGNPAMAACRAEDSTTAQGTPVSAWGNNFFGQLGNETYNADSNTPVEVSNLDGAEVKSLAGGQGHSLALKNDGTVWAWGLNQDGRLGDGTNTDSSTPVQVSDLDGVKGIAAGGAHSLALKDDGTAWAWGANPYGQLGNGTNTLVPDMSERGQGNGTNTVDINTPEQVSDLGEVTLVAAGDDHSLGA